MGLFNTSANSSQPDWSLSAEIEIFSFVLVPKTIIMQMNKINLKQTAYKLSNQLSNIIVVNICKLLSLTYQDFHVQFRLRCMMGPSSSSTPVFFPRKKKLFCSSGKTLKFNVFSSEVRQNIRHWKREEDSLELNLELSGILKSFKSS